MVDKVFDKGGAVARHGMISMMMFAASLFCVAARAEMPEGPGMQKVAKEDYAGAKSFFQRILHDKPRDASASAGMAAVALARGENKSAVDWAQQAISLEPGNASYRMLLGVAYGEYVHDVNPLSQLGIAYKVRDAFEQAVQLAPDDAQARAGLAKYYILAPGIAGGSAAKAAEQLAALDKIDAAQAATVRATLAQQDKDAQTTEIHLRTAARLDPLGGGHYWLGVFLIEQQRYADALFAFSDGIARNPDNSANFFGFGQAAGLGKLQLQQGIRSLHKFLTMPHDWLPGTPTYKEAHYRLGVLYALAGDKTQAQAQYAAALGLDPAYQPAKIALAQL